MAEPAPVRPRRLGYRDAARLLAERDPVIAKLVDDVGLPVVPVPKEAPFATLVRSITYQQIATPAAAAIHGRLVAALGEVTPERLLELTPDDLRAVGLSGAKILSVRDLAAKVLDGTVVLDPRRLARLSDAEIARRLSAVRGIGTWSADMFLLFRLRRMDVWPTGDLAVRKGWALAWQVPVPTAKELDPLGDPYRPYRSVVAWYCWQAAERYKPRA